MPVLPQRGSQQFGDLVEIFGPSGGIGIAEVEIAHVVGGYHVDVGVGYLIASDQQPDPSAGDRFSLGEPNASGHAHEMQAGGLVEVDPMVDLLLRDDQAMAAMQRSDVDHGDADIVIPHEPSGELAGDDARKDRGHRGIIGDSTCETAAAMLCAMTEASTGRGDDDRATIYVVADGVATITLNRPERKNALSEELVNSLADDLDAAMVDDGVRVIVITNTGNTFCAGADLKAERPGQATGEPKRTFVDVMNLILDAPKPIVGRIDGHATGGGVGLVAVLDISVMRDDAKIGFTEARIGVAPAVISVVCLPKMRRADASELFLTGERITPARAAEVGLINRAVPADQLDRALHDLTSMVVRCGPLALAACKQLIARVPTMDRAEAFEWTSATSQALFQSDEAAAGIAAFRERRDAPWVPGAASR